MSGEKYQEILSQLQSDPLLSQKQVCGILGVSPKTLQRLRRDNRLPFVRFSHRDVRIRASAVQRLMELGARAR